MHIAHGRQSWIGSMRYRQVTKLHQHLHPYIYQHLLYSTYTFHIVSMLVPLCPSHSPNCSNECQMNTALSNYYGMQSFMKPNVSAIMTRAPVSRFNRIRAICYLIRDTILEVASMLCPSHTSVRSSEAMLMET